MGPAAAPFCSTAKHLPSRFPCARRWSHDTGIYSLLDWPFIPTHSAPLSFAYLTDHPRHTSSEPLIRREPPRCRALQHRPVTSRHLPAKPLDIDTLAPSNTLDHVSEEFITVSGKRAWKNRTSEFLHCRASGPIGRPSHYQIHSTGEPLAGIWVVI